MSDTPVRAAVLELTSALHNWRKDPNPVNVEALTLAAWAVIGHALELERRTMSLEQPHAARQWICGMCRASNLLIRDTCWSCEARKP